MVVAGFCKSTFVILLRALPLFSSRMKALLLFLNRIIQAVLPGGSIFVPFPFVFGNSEAANLFDVVWVKLARLSELLLQGLMPLMRSAQRFFQSQPGRSLFCQAAHHFLAFYFRSDSFCIRRGATTELFYLFLGLLQCFFRGFPGGLILRQILRVLLLRQVHQFVAALLFCVYGGLKVSSRVRPWPCRARL